MNELTIFLPAIINRADKNAIVRQIEYAAKKGINKVKIFTQQNMFIERDIPAAIDYVLS